MNSNMLSLSSLLTVNRFESLQTKVVRAVGAFDRKWKRRRSPAGAVLDCEHDREVSFSSVERLKVSRFLDNPEA